MKKINWFVITPLLLFFLVSPSLFCAQVPDQERRVALVIGNSTYQNSPPLSNPRNDAIEIGNALKRIGFDVDVVVDASKPQMDQALRQFGNKLEGSSAAVFYYAGHGIQVNGTNYLLPSQLIITSISGVVAKGYYSWGSSYQAKIMKGWVKFNGKVEGPGILSWGNKYFLKFIFDKEKNSIQGTHTYDSQGRDRVSRGLFRRPADYK